MEYLPLRALQVLLRREWCEMQVVCTYMRRTYPVIPRTCSAARRKIGWGACRCRPCAAYGGGWWPLSFVSLFRSRLATRESTLYGVGQSNIRSINLHPLCTGM